MFRPVIVLGLLLLSCSLMAQKRESNYRSDGKNTFTASVLTGYDKFIRDSQNSSQAFGLGFQGAYARQINSTLDIRFFQRFSRLVDESQFVLIGPDKLIHSYLLTGLVADITIVRYDMFVMKLSVGPVAGYNYKIRIKGSGGREVFYELGQAFAGFNMGATFETYPVKKLVLGLRINYDQLFLQGDGYGNVYPGPFIGVRF